MTYTVVQSWRVYSIDLNNDYQTSIGFKNKGKKENVLCWSLSENLYLVSSVLLHILGMWFLNDNQIYMATKFRHPAPGLNTWNPVAPSSEQGAHFRDNLLPINTSCHLIDSSK